MRLIFLLIIAFKCFYSFGQITPYFLTTIYFKDAIGNLDSIEIGFDTIANDYSNPEFGEITDLSPFNNILDVRAVNYFEYYNTTPPIRPLNLLSGRIVGRMEKYVNAPCYAPSFFIFFIYAKYQPITISVKSVSVFQKIDCPGHNTWNFFSPDRTYHFIEPWGWAATPGVRFGCLKDSIFTLYLDKSSKPSIEKPYLLKYEVDGIGIDSIFGICLVGDQTFYQCDSTFVDTDDKSSINDYALYPNPLSEYLNIRIQDIDSPLNCEIFNQAGILVSKFKIENQSQIRIDTHDMSIGIYYIKLNYKCGSKIKSFIKI
ncbi:MAG: T9SS type A sorting domain-containing protein [Saprospiraceae bacterium]|jgi:hypothetical protein